jgi:hypothetical protein
MLLVRFPAGGAIRRRHLLVQSRVRARPTLGLAGSWSEDTNAAADFVEGPLRRADLWDQEDLGPTRVRR